MYGPFSNIQFQWLHKATTVNQQQQKFTDSQIKTYFWNTSVLIAPFTNFIIFSNLNISITSLHIVKNYNFVGS